mgnify:CR=1 FL=1
MINGQVDDMSSRMMGQVNCSILLGEMKEMVRKLRSYGVGDADIEAVMHEDEVLPNLIITDNFRIFIGENRREVHMEPLVKSVYVLFVKHPEGIIFKDLPDYRMEVTYIYSKIRPWGLTDRALHSIEDVTNPLLNSINEKCARIRKAFVTMLDSKIAEKYYINGTRGKVKRISLPRELIIWE